MTAKSAECLCTHNFTCGVCLDRCVERNLADALADPWHPNHFPSPKAER